MNHPFWGTSNFWKHRYGKFVGFKQTHWPKRGQLKNPALAPGFKVGQAQEPLKNQTNTPPED